DTEETERTERISHRDTETRRPENFCVSVSPWLYCALRAHADSVSSTERYNRRACGLILRSNDGLARSTRRPSSCRTSSAEAFCSRHRKWRETCPTPGGFWQPGW